MNKQMTICQHYVPQFYLRNFVNENNQLWVYDRKKQKIFQSPPRAICQEDNLYEVKWEGAVPQFGKYVLHNRIENMLSNQEGNYQSVIQEIISQCKSSKNSEKIICDTEQKNKLSVFIANLIFRNPYLFGEEKYLASDLYQMQDIEQLFTDLGWGSIDSLIKLAYKQIMLDDSVYNSDANMFAREIQNLDFLFLVTENETFVTSSFPVQYIIYGNDCTPVYIFFPLCPQIAVMYMARKVGINYINRIFKSNDGLVIGANKLYLSSKLEHTRFIISHNRQNVERLKGQDAHIKKRGV